MHANESVQSTEIITTSETELVHYLVAGAFKFMQSFVWYIIVLFCKGPRSTINVGLLAELLCSALTQTQSNYYYQKGVLSVT